MRLVIARVPITAVEQRISRQIAKWLGPGSNRRHMDFQSLYHHQAKRKKSPEFTHQMAMRQMACLWHVSRKRSS